MVGAYNDIWIIGDYFLKDANAELQGLKKMSISKHLPQPYIHENFNVHTRYADLVIKGIARLLNPLVEILNFQHRLPKYIIVVPDKDLISTHITTPLEDQQWGLVPQFIS